MRKIRYIENDLIHTYRKYYEVFYVFYSFQDRNKVILMEINMRLKRQRRELVTLETPKNQRSMYVSALAVIQMFCFSISV